LASTIRRPQKGRYIFGVCAGIADWLTWDVSIIRLLALIAMFLLVGIPILIYFALWLIIPAEPRKDPAIRQPDEKPKPPA
jgi:phage shock protein PspC (stress-responsive transcriptional regulator)